MEIKVKEELSAYKWLITSCLQKSIRRGRFDLAENYVNFLWDNDKNYLIYRLGTILTEDVGIANKELVVKYLATKLSKKSIEAEGGLDFVMEIVHKACESIKDRSSCDAAYLASHTNYKIKDHKTSEIIFSNDKENYLERIMAGWTILGFKKFKHEKIEINSERIVGVDDIELYLRHVEDISSPLVANLVRNAYATQSENICLGVPIIENIFQKELVAITDKKLKAGAVIQHNYIAENEFLHQETGLKLISCGLDGHTREGKSIYYKFLKSGQQFTQYMDEYQIPVDRHMDLLKHAIFRVEGHEVNKRVYFPNAVSVMRDCEERVLNAKAGFEENLMQFADVKKIIIDAMPTINEMRCDALKTVAKNAYKAMRI